MTPAFQPDPIEPLASEWLDRADTSSPRESLERIARWQLLHALLSFALRSARENHDARIHSVLQAIDEERAATAQPIIRSRSRWMSLLATAAILMLAVGLWLAFGSPPSAYAVVRSAQQQAAQVIDRVYRVRLQPRLASMPSREGTLYVRGGEKLAYKHPTLLGESLWLGTNGNEGWLVPPHGPVLVREDPYYLKLWQNEQGEQLPFLQLTTVLERMQQGYDLEILPPDNDPQQTIKLTHVRGTRRAGESGPQQIDMWADTRNGNAQRMLFTFERDSLVLPFFQVSFELMNDQSVASDWYEHRAHHGEERPVVRIPRNVTSQK